MPVLSKLLLSPRYRRVLRESPPLLSPADACEFAEGNETPKTRSSNPSVWLSGPMEQGRPLSTSRSRDEEDSSLAKKNLLMHRLRISLSVEIQQDATLTLLLDAIDAWLVLYHLYGFTFTEEDLTRDTQQVLKVVNDAWVICCCTGNWMTYFKYKEAAFFSVWNNQVVPEEPEGSEKLKRRNPKYLLGGRFYKFTNVLARTNEMESFSLSILMSKKGQPRPTEDQVRYAEERAAFIMSTPKPEWVWELDWTEMHHYRMGTSYGRRELQPEIRRTTLEILKGMSLKVNDLVSLQLPSSSSNYRCTREDLGTYGALESTGLLATLRHEYPTPMGEDFLKWKPQLCKLSGYISEYYGEKGQTDEQIGRIIGECREVVGLEIDNCEFITRYRRFFWRCYDYALKEEPLVQVVGLQESLKIRCITKGPPITYFVLKSMQQLLWKRLQGFWNFELTGKPITTELMNRRFGRVCSDPEGTIRFHSGDYSAATDELHSWASEEVAETICDYMNSTNNFPLGDAWRPLLLKALTRHVYTQNSHMLEKALHKRGSAWCEEDLMFRLPQRVGQLMGSIISFPVLCICNAALIRKSYELAHGVTCRLREVPCWINGDDCLTQYTDPSFPKIWSKLGTIMGLRESVGKTYDSPHMASINSHFFDLGECGQWSMRPYINLGLMYCYKRDSKNKEKKRDKNPFEMGPLHKELVEKAGVYHELAHRFFLYKHMNVLKQYKGPWFLPNWLCGAGLQPVTYEYTREERATCMVLADWYGKLEKVPPTISTDRDWCHYTAFRKGLTDRFPIGDYFYESHDHDELHGVAFVSFCWMKWLSEGISALHNPTKCDWKREGNRAQRLWASAVEKKDMKRVLASSAICTEVKKTIMPVWAQRGMSETKRREE